MFARIAQALVGQDGPRPGDWYFWSDLLSALGFFVVVVLMLPALYAVAAGAPDWLLVGPFVLFAGGCAGWVVALIRRA